MRHIKLDKAERITIGSTLNGLICIRVEYKRHRTKTVYTYGHEIFWAKKHTKDILIALAGEAGINITIENGKEG